MGDKTCFVVDDLLLLICMENTITTEDVIGLADLYPVKIVLGEHCLKDDTALSNAYYVLKEIELKLV